MTCKYTPTVNRWHKPAEWHRKTTATCSRQGKRQDRQCMYLQYNILAHSLSHCCSGNTTKHSVLLHIIS